MKIIHVLWDSFENVMVFKFFKTFLEFLKKKKDIKLKISGKYKGKMIGIELNFL